MVEKVLLNRLSPCYSTTDDDERGALSSIGTADIDKSTDSDGRHSRFLSFKAVGVGGVAAWKGASGA